MKNGFGGGQQSQVSVKTKEQEVAEAFAVAHKYHLSGDLQKAEAIYRNIFEADPNHVDTINNLSVILIDRKEFNDANLLLEHGMQIAPDNHRIVENFGYNLAAQGREEAALPYYEKALTIEPKSQQTYVMYGKLLYLLGKYDQATEQYKKALKINPKNIAAMENLAATDFVMGNFDESIDLYEKVIELNPKCGRLYRTITQSKKFKSADDRHVKMIEGFDIDGVDAESRSHIFFAKGKIYSDLKEYDKSFEYYKKGNDIKQKLIPYDQYNFDRFFTQAKELYTKAFWDNNKFSGSSSEVPVFVVGMPRSGTTLTEQIIARHPDVDGAGELPFITRNAAAIASLMKDPKITQQNAGVIVPPILKKFAQDYLHRLTLNVKDKNVKHVVDKQPTNFQYLSEIALLFPKAKIVHCKRNALDTCISNYFQYFIDGNTFANNLESLAHYFNAYENIMEFYKENLPLEIYDLEYEKLTSSPEEEARKLLEFIGLEFDERCIHPEESKRAASTASAWQVKQPIYQTSQQRWRRYEEHLQPLIKALNNPPV